MRVKVEVEVEVKVEVEVEVEGEVEVEEAVLGAAYCRAAHGLRPRPPQAAPSPRTKALQPRPSLTSVNGGHGR